MSRAAALAAVLLAACYQPRAEEALDTATAPGAAGGGGSSSSSPYGSIGDDRGRLSDGDFTLYWRWYGDVAWTNGTCVELRLRNNGSSVSWRDMELDLDAELTRWVYEDGGFFWPDSDQILVEPTGRGRLTRYESAMAYFCAEPAVRIDDFSIDTVAGSGSDDRDDDPDPDDGDDDKVLGDAATGLDGVRLYYREVQDGACLELNLLNSGTKSWTITETRMEFPEDVELTDYWEAIFRVEGGDLYALWPGYLGALDPGEQFRGTACFEPLAEPDSVTVTGTVATGD